MIRTVLQRLKRLSGRPRTREHCTSTEEVYRKIRTARLCITIWELPSGMILSRELAQYIESNIRVAILSRKPYSVVRHPQEVFPEGVVCYETTFVLGELSDREALRLQVSSGGDTRIVFERLPFPTLLTGL